MSLISNEIKNQVLDLHEKYSDSPLFKMLIILITKSIPIASNISDTLVEAINYKLTKMRLERVRLFFEELEKNEEHLTKDLINNNEFIHKFMITYSAAVRTYRYKKIQVFARLLANSEKNESYPDVDLYEEYVNIIDDLSYRELYALNILHYYEENNSDKKAEEYWDKFKADLKEELLIKEKEIKPFLRRLERTGCYRIEQMESSWNRNKEYGYLTFLYKQISSFIHEQN